MVVNKTIHVNKGDVPDILLNMFPSDSPGIRNPMNQQVVAPDPVFPQSYRNILNKQEFIIHNSVTRSVQYSLYTLPKCQPFMTNLELDGIESILTITS
jgi:hypothetical protein